MSEEYRAASKKYSMYATGAKAILSVAGVGGAAGAGVPGVTPGLVTAGGTVTTATTGAATTVTVTEVVTVGGSVGARVAAGVASATWVVFTGVGQLIGHGFSHLWDPHPIDSFTPRSYALLDLSDMEIDAALFRLFSQIKSLTKYGHLFSHIDSIRDIEHVDSEFPELGNSLARGLRTGIRTWVHMLQGAAAATAGDHSVVRDAAQLLRADLDTYVQITRKLASLLEDNPNWPSLAPSTESEYLQFVEAHRLQGRSAIPLIEEIVLYNLYDVSKTRWRGSDPRDSIAKWVARTPTTDELEIFRSSPTRTVSFVDILRDGVQSFADYDPLNSPIIPAR